MRYSNLYLKDKLDIDQVELKAKNIGYGFNKNQEHVYMGLEADIDWLTTLVDEDNIIRLGKIVLQATNVKTLVVGTQIYTGKWAKHIGKQGTVYYVFNTSIRGNKACNKIPYIGFKQVGIEIEPGYTEITFTVAPTCPFYKEIARKIKV